ncbi:restriction endonuclease [Thiocystis minor]|uniref:restriction endonuclease n=1 Tax=Thiocystis minor TaxID=61597 RepID=UPI001912CE62|nr:restriction endonuclease [Thiocystis minor]MBK5965756.1 restriction endonuclease [Thiocystis minor]
MTDQSQHIVRTPLFPEYSQVRSLLPIWANTTTKSAVLNLINAVWDQTGTPQNPVDWSHPDEWISERLTGEDAELATRIWSKSQKTINPRHLYGVYLFINSYQLLIPDSEGVYRLSARGQAFLDEDPMAVREIDEAEGLPNLLLILAAHSPAKRGDLLDDWAEFLHKHSKYGTASTIKDTLRRRILNLVERGCIAREGNTYTITNQGIAYAADSSEIATERPHQEVLNAIKRYNDTQIQALRDRLGKMNPYRFEALIRDLLEAMDYEDVIVTKQSGDKGVDVIANYQFGITQIKEVVQVKRYQGSITRPVLDQLRGALPYHQAIRGTIITLGRFAKGCTEAALYPGAAPITLIDGDKLMELLVKHGVGIKKRPQTLVEIDDSYFAEADATDGDEALLTPTD